MTGVATVPMVAAVATLEPDVAAKTMQAPMLACISPPGSQESHWLIDAYSRSAIPDRSRISPSRINSGTLTKRKLLEADQTISPMARCTGRFEKSCASTRARISSAAATGRLSPRSRRRSASEVGTIALQHRTFRRGLDRREDFLQLLL